jgi:MinD superfamily P-loop ATPase
MKIAIASGKGGTGKTTVAVNLALARGNVQLLDCDVEDPDAALFLHPQISEVAPVHVSMPKLLPHKCTYCAHCSDFCAYNAITVLPELWLLAPQLCKDCGGCYIVCPEDALVRERRQIGLIHSGGAERSVDVVSGDLAAGEATPTPLIRTVKERAHAEGFVIIDGPPGTSCAMIHAIEGSDFCLLVTEPTPFGLHDLKLAIEVVKRLNLPYGVVINRSDIGNADVRNFCNEKGIPILLEIPFDEEVAAAYARGIPAVAISERWRGVFSELFERIQNMRPAMHARE